MKAKSDSFSSLIPDSVVQASCGHPDTYHHFRLTFLSGDVIMACCFSPDIISICIAPFGGRRVF